MIVHAARSAFLLTWILSTQSTLGFQLTNSPTGRDLAYLTNGVTAPRRSALLPGQRMPRNIRLEAFWKSQSSADDEEQKEESETALTEDDVVDTTMSSTDETSDETKPATSREKSLLALVNEIGNNFRAMAQKSTAKGYQCEDQMKKILYAAKACAYYTLFILYRAYRGFFVLLPATFKQVYGKMEAAMNTGNLSMEEIGFDEDGKDVTNTSSKWRTKITVSILTTIITASYIVGGVLKMATRFVRTIAKTSDVPKSFGAAADEVLDIEGRISRVGKVNGDGDVEASGLTP